MRRAGCRQNALPEGHDCRDRSDLGGGSELLLGLGVDLGEHDVGVWLRDRSKTGAKARHGPHHDAQKSTSTTGSSRIVDRSRGGQIGDDHSDVLPTGRGIWGDVVSTAQARPLSIRFQYMKGSPYFFSTSTPSGLVGSSRGKVGSSSRT